MKNVNYIKKNGKQFEKYFSDDAFLINCNTFIYKYFK